MATILPNVFIFDGKTLAIPLWQKLCQTYLFLMAKTLPNRSPFLNTSLRHNSYTTQSHMFYYA